MPPPGGASLGALTQVWGSGLDAFEGHEETALVMLDGAETVVMQAIDAVESFLRAPPELAKLRCVEAGAHVRPGPAG